MESKTRMSTLSHCPPLPFLFIIVLEVFNSSEGRKRKHPNQRGRVKIEIVFIHTCSKSEHRYKKNLQELKREFKFVG